MKAWLLQVARASGDSLYERLAGVLLVLLPVWYAISPSIADGVGTLLGVLGLYHAWRTNTWAWARSAWFVLAIVLAGYLLVQGFFVEQPMEAMKRGAPWVRFPLFAAAVAYWLLPKVAVRQALYRVLGYVLLFLLADTFFQYVVGVDVLGRETFPADGGGDRLTGPFTAPKVGIILVWLGFPVLIGWLLPAEGGDARARLRAVARGAALLMCFIAVVFLTGERMAFLLTGFGLVVAMLMQPSMLKRLWMPALAAVMAMVLFCWSNPQLVSRQIDSTVRSMQHIPETPYGMIWGSALAIVKEHPVFGVGARHFRIVCPRPEYGTMDAEKLKLRCNLHPHNIYLEWLVEGGVLGLSLFVVLAGLLVVQCVRAYRIAPRDAVLLGVIAGVAIRLWPLSTSVSGFVGWSAVPMWLLIGWMLSYTVAETVTKKEV